MYININEDAVAKGIRTLREGGKLKEQCARPLST